MMAINSYWGRFLIEHLAAINRSALQNSLTCGSSVRFATQRRFAKAA